MRWPWTESKEMAGSPESKEMAGSLDRILAIMERRALEDEETRERERDVLLNELHRRLVAEEIDDPIDRVKAESRVEAARSHGWEPRDAIQE